MLLIHIYSIYLYIQFIIESSLTLFSYLIQEIVGLASRILKVAMLMDKPRGTEKRNHGLIDTIINLPDLDKIGKK